jgi:hypothetical protein
MDSRKTISKNQLEKKKYKSRKNIDFDTLIQFESDLIKELERNQAKVESC